MATPRRMRLVRTAAAARTAKASRIGPSSPTQNSSRPASSAAWAAATSWGALVLGNSQRPRRTTSAGCRAEGVLRRNLAAQAETGGHAVDVGVVRREVVEGHDVGVAEPDRAELVDVGGR